MVDEGHFPEARTDKFARLLHYTKLCRFIFMGSHLISSCTSQCSAYDKCMHSLLPCSLYQPAIACQSCAAATVSFELPSFLASASVYFDSGDRDQGEWLWGVAVMDYILHPCLHAPIMASVELGPSPISSLKMGLASRHLCLTFL